jgi:hypothetical protein
MKRAHEDESRAATMSDDLTLCAARSESAYARLIGGAAPHFLRLFYALAD